MKRIPVGISSCLLGERVRYDGRHKLDRTVTEVLARYLEYLPCCPEVAIGLGVPRATLHLEHTARGVRALQPQENGRDVTAKLSAIARGVADHPLAGYILKAKSPSCGLRRVSIRAGAGQPAGSGSGIFAAALRRRRPLLPMEDETQLADPRYRDSFLERVFVLHRWQHRPPSQPLAAFHARCGFLAKAHCAAAARELEAMASTGRRSSEERYLQCLMTALARPAARNRLSDVLAAAWPRGRSVKIIEDYRRGAVPVIAPLLQRDRSAEFHG